MSIKQNLYNLWFCHKMFIIIILILLLLNSIFISLYIKKEKFTQHEITGKRLHIGFIVLIIILILLGAGVRYFWYEDHR